MRALVVNDEQTLAEIVGTHLDREGFAVRLARTGEEALVAALVVDPDVVVLDLALPDIDGIEVCRRLRLFSDCYVVMLTDHAGEPDVLFGLAVGADDFMTKPISTCELVARIHAIARRPRVSRTPGSAPRQVLTVGPLTIDPGAREARVDGALVPMTRTEFDLLWVLASQPLLTFTREALVEAVWGDRTVCNDHIVDVHIGHLRHKLGDTIGSQRLISTVRGVGYQIGRGV